MTTQRALRNLLPTVSLAAALFALPLATHAQNGYPQNGYPQDGTYGQQNGYPQQDGYAQDNGYPQQQDNGYQTVDQAPPAIPEFDQPEAPGDGYLWTPGYWAFGPQGYYWVQGAWVEPPYTGALWTPGWWGYNDNYYFWNAGYWGPTVGYYGGINYGFGYFGVGFYGGYWGGGRFYYNRAYNHFGYGFRGNVYNRPYGGYNGRPGGPAFNGHPPIQYVGRNNNGGRSSFYHGATVNNGFHNQAAVNGSRGYENRGYAQQQGFAGNHNEVARNPQVTTYSYGQHGEVGTTRYNSSAAAQRGFEGGQQNYSRSSSAPAQQQNYSRSYSAPAQQQNYSRSYSAPSQQSAPRSYSAPSSSGYSGGGGGSHASAPSSGGGGGSHGGGGGRH